MSINFMLKSIQFYVRNRIIYYFTQANFINIVMPVLTLKKECKVC